MPEDKDPFAEFGGKPISKTTNSDPFQEFGGTLLKKKVSTSVSLNTLPSFQSGLSNFQGSPQSIENSPVTQAGMAEVLQQQNHARQQQPQGLIPVKLTKPASATAQSFTQTNGSIRKDKSWENLGDFIPQTVLGGLQKDAGQAIGLLGNVLPKGPTPLLTKEAGKSVADFGARLESAGKEKQAKASELGLPETVGGTVASSAIGFAPDILELILMPELDIAKFGKLSEVLGKYGTKAAQVATGKFPTLMATKGLTSGYVEAKDKGANDYDATKAALIKSAEEYGKGALFEGAGKIAGKVSDIGKKALEDAGWMANGKIVSGAQKAILNSSAQATAFSAVPFITNAVEGKSTSLKELQDNAIFGGVLGLFHGSGAKEGDHTAADGAAAQIAERTPLIDLHNFAAADIDAIKEVHDMPENAADLKVKSAIGAEQAFKAETPAEKQQAIVQSSIDGKAASVKAVTQAILKDKQAVIDAIPEDLPNRDELVDKINEVHKMLDPTEQKKSAIGAQISDIDAQIQSASEKSTDPVLQAENEVKLENLIKQREKLNNSLKDIITKQNEQTQPNTEIPAKQPADAPKGENIPVDKTDENSRNTQSTTETEEQKRGRKARENFVNTSDGIPYVIQESGGKVTVGIDEKTVRNQNGLRGGESILPHENTEVQLTKEETRELRNIERDKELGDIDGMEYSKQKRELIKKVFKRSLENESKKPADETVSVPQVADKNDGTVEINPPAIEVTKTPVEAKVEPPVIEPVAKVERAKVKVPVPEYKDIRQEAIDKHGEATPENLAKEANAKTWYHGSGKDLSTERIDSAGYSRPDGLLGLGFYMTDNPDIAESYAGKRKGTPTVNEFNVNTSKLLDAEAPIHEDVANTYKKSFRFLFDSDKDVNDFFDKVKKDKPDANLMDYHKAIRDMIVEDGIPTSEVHEAFQDLEANLKDELGYDAISHVGGAVTKGKPHNVMIVLDPSGEYSEPRKTFTKAGVYQPKYEDAKPTIKEVKETRAEAPETIAENKSPANPKQEAISPSQGDAGVSTKVKPVEHVKTFKLEVNEDLAKNDISLRGVQMSDGKFGIFQERNGRVMGKTLGRTFDTPEALQEAYDGGIKDKLTSDAINKATKEADISRQDESKPVDNKDKAKIFADKIRSLKVNKTAADIKKSNMHGGLAGVGIAVYDGALEIAATIVEAGGSMADAIQAAVRHIKDNSDNKNDKEIYYSVRKELQSTGLLEASDIDYTKELKDAKQSQLSVINKGKSDDMLKMLGDIDPRHLNAEEIVKYNDIVNNKETSRDDIAKFIDDVHSRQDEEAQQREVDWYKQLKEEDATPETQEALAEAAKAENDIKDKPTDDKAKKVLKKLLQVSRKDLRNADISKEFDAVKSAIIALDESKLTTRQLRDLNRDIEAMIYDGKYNGSGKWIALNEAIDKSATILDKLKKLAFKTNTTSVFASGFRSLDQNLETILRSSKAASILQEKSGIHDISAGNARVNKAMNSATERFTKLIDKMPSDIQSVENRYKRGVLSLFTQNNNGISSAEHFELYKDRVSKSADALLKSDNKAENREGELVKSIYDKFVKDAQSSDEVVKAMTKDNPNNAKLISHFIGEYSKVYPELRKNTMLYSGRELPSIENYTATSFKKLHNADQTIAPAFEITDPLSSDKEDFSTDKGQSRTTLKRVGGMPKNKVMDLDFDGLQLNRLRESHYDVQTLASRYLFDAIRKQPDFNEAVGDNVGNVNAISEGVANMVKSQRGFNVTDPLAKIVLSATGRLRKAGVLIALKGVDQFVKQYPSVAVNTLMNLGADADLYAKALLVDIHNPIFNESGIGLRGLQAGGTSFENQLRTARISDFKRFSDSRAWINNKLHGVNTLLSKPLSMSDDAVARHSWLAYYMQDLRKQGTDVSAIDWSKEHENINKEAAAYAEQMVSRNQIPNDPSKNAAFTQRGDVKDGKDLAFEVMKDVVIPFTSFARNTSVGIANNIRKFYGGDKMEAAKGLAATVAEAAVFNTIKAALGVFLYQNAQNMILQQFGYLKPKDKNIDIKGIATNTADDLLFAGMGSIVDNGIKSTINAAYATAKDDPRAQIFKVFDPSKFGETNWNSLGVYGVLPEKIQNMAQAIDYSDGSISERDRGGRKYTTYLSDKQAHLAQIVVALDLLSTIGLIGASTSRLSSQVFREIKKLKAPVKYSSGKYHNKQSGSEQVSGEKPSEVDKSIKKIKLPNGPEFELNDAQIKDREKINDAFIQKNGARLKSALERKALTDKTLLKKIHDRSKVWKEQDVPDAEKKKFKQDLVDDYVQHHIKLIANKHSMPYIYKKYKNDLKLTEE